MLTHVPGPSYTPGRYRTESNSLWGLAATAFKKHYSFELECPRWMATTYFAVNATLPEGTTKADLPIMIQHLLEDRFALKYHHETRQMAGYELVVAKSGSKLAKSATPDFDGAALKDVPIGFKNGVPQFGKDAGSADGCGPGGCYLHGHNRTMQALAADLVEKLHGPVMDATGLEGGYDYTLLFTGEVYSGPGIVSPMPPGGMSGAGAAGDGAPAPLERPLLRDALREQLGLELRPVKNVPVEVVVIDSANKVPTEN
jgi:uncharacterized protein (TIGR03435 family)